MVLMLSAIAVVMFTFNLTQSLRAYRNRPRPDRRRVSSRLRAVISAFVLEVGMVGIFIGRSIATLSADPELRRGWGLVNAAALSGAIIIGGALICYLWIVDGDRDVQP